MSMLALGDAGPRRVLYVVHDVTDPAVHRRVSMMQEAGARIHLVGFRRSATQADSSDVPITNLGESLPGRLGHRIALILRSMPIVLGLPQSAIASDVILARNLESLMLAVLLKRFRLPHARLVYECLDIHNLMLSRSRSGSIARAVERFCMRQASAILVSSPAFVTNYFASIPDAPPVHLVENKVLGFREQNHLPVLRGQRAAPWTIGWFGNLRCARSLYYLDALTRRLNGTCRVLLAGRPALDVLPNFHALVDANPFISFRGPYQPSDLPSLYDAVDFAWAVDFFQAGANSDWLLPNRIYEGCYFGCVPIALRDVEIGRWLQRRRAGVLFETLGDELETFLLNLTPDHYASLSQSVQAIDKADLAFDKGACADLLDLLSGSNSGADPALLRQHSIEPVPGRVA